MRVLDRRSKTKQWARLALKFALLLTDAKLWGSITEHLGERASDMTDDFRRKYDDTTDRLSEARRALQGRSHWVASTTCFLGGVGVGVGIGMLFAPATGEETRSVLRDKAMEMTNRASENVTGTSRSTAYAASPSTGTHGD